LKKIKTLEDAREKALKNPYYFIKRVMGFDRMIPHPHQTMLDFKYNTDYDRKLLLSPRGSFKSSVITVGATVWDIVKNPNIRILIVHETQKSAIRYVKEIKTHFEQNVKLRALFGDYVSKDNTWRDNEFIVSKRTVPRRDATVMAASLEKGTIVGLHFDRIILDDVVSMNNINSPEQLEKNTQLLPYAALNS